MEAPPKMVKPPSHYIQAAQLIYTRNIEWQPNTGIFQCLVTKELHTSGGYTVGREAETVWGMLHQGRGREEKKRSRQNRGRKVERYRRSSKRAQARQLSTWHKYQRMTKSKEVDACNEGIATKKRGAHGVCACAYSNPTHSLPSLTISYLILLHLIL